MKLLLGLLGLLMVAANEWADAIDCDSLQPFDDAKTNCGDTLQGKCECKRTICNVCDGMERNVVSCINSNFNDPDLLAHLPNNTQVLIFTGNHLGELPWNVFGTRLECLKIIDMSNNHIREIRGKTYHHVNYVERLILDYNNLTLDPGHTHPRLFSNFASLRELHLTDAFEDGKSEDLADTLHQIFVNSNLTQLIKLHLEQNEIESFKDREVFCDLPNLMDLHLGDNSLTELRFDIRCLPKLRFLDLQRNKFPTVPQRDLNMLDSFPKRNQTMTIDLSNNPFKCNCQLLPFVRWSETTKVNVRNVQYLKCIDSSDSTGKSIKSIEKVCLAKKSSALKSRIRSSYLITLLTLVLVSLVCAYVYVSRRDLNKSMKTMPVLDSVSKRVKYTSIARDDV